MPFIAYRVEVRRYFNPPITVALFIYTDLANYIKIWQVNIYRTWMLSVGIIGESRGDGATQTSPDYPTVLYVFSRRRYEQ